MSHNQLSKYAVAAFSGLLTVSSVVALGFLSFAGFYLLFPSVLLASISMVLATLIEFTVIYQNIYGALNKLFMRHHLKNLLTQRLLRQLVKEGIEDSVFLCDFDQQRRYIHQLKHVEGKNPKQAEALRQAEKTFNRMIKQCRRYIFHPVLSRSSFKGEFQVLVGSRREAFLQTFHRKYGLSRGAIVPVVIAAISCGFVTYTTIGTSLSQMLPFLQVIIPGLSISIASLAPVIVGFAVVAGAAYFLQILNTTFDMIYNDSLKKLAQDIWGNVKQGGVGSVIYGVSVFVLVGLGVFVTVATAGTWWEAVKPAVAVFARSETPAKVINIISIFFYGCAGLAFNLENTHETLEQMKAFSLKKTFAKIKKRNKKVLGRENLGQKLNPFRALLVVIKVPFRLVNFLAHVISIGVTTDNLGGKVLNFVSAGAASVTESFEDWHYIMVSDHHHGGGDGHDHNHADVLGALFVIIAFVPLILPSITWDWLASRHQQDPSRRLSFKQAWQKGFGTTPKSLPEAPHLSDQWLVEETMMKLRRKYGDYEAVNPNDFGQSATAAQSAGLRLFDHRVKGEAAPLFSAQAMSQASSHSASNVAPLSLREELRLV